MAAVMSGSSVLSRSSLLRYSYQVQNARLKSTSTAASSYEEAQPVRRSRKTSPTRRDDLDLTFNDNVKAFRSKTNYELVRGLVIFKICGIKTIVDNNMQLMKIGQTILGKNLFARLMKATFYGHFVAGEDRVRIQPTIEKLHSFGVKSILDYSVEEDISEETAAEREMESMQSKATIASELAEGDKSCATHDVSGGAPKTERFSPHKEFADRRQKVLGARTYFYINEAQCETNMDTFIKCIDAVSDATRGTGFAAIKMTALGRPQLLMQLSETIYRTRQYFNNVTKRTGPVISANMPTDVFKDRFKEEAVGKVDNPQIQEWLDSMTYDKKGLIHLFTWSGLIDSNMLLKELFQVPNLKTHKMEPLISALSDEEEEMFKNMMRRLHTIFQYAKERDVRVMVDAEQSYFQPAISRLTMELMKKYNTEKAIVFNTYQCYLKETYNNLTLDLEQCYRQNFFFGCKLVRGAYMEQERERAEALGYADPVNENFDATTEMYHNCLLSCLQNIQRDKENDIKDKLAIMVASHNEDTIRFTIKNMEKYGVRRADRLICFGQLLGMCDHISMPLGQSGYSVYKYVPYGPVNEVLPYLSRRAQENSSLLVKLEKEKHLMKRELMRRVTSGQVSYEPEGHYLPLGAKQRDGSDVVIEAKN